MTGQQAMLKAAPTASSGIDQYSVTSTQRRSMTGQQAKPRKAQHRTASPGTRPRLGSRSQVEFATTHPNCIKEPTYGYRRKGSFLKGNPPTTWVNPICGNGFAVVAAQL